MLNDVLFNALKKKFGDVQVKKEGDPGAYRLPYKHRKEMLVTQRTADVPAYAEVMKPWGECYVITCPVCGDSRHKHKLYVCYLAGCRMKLRGRWVSFSNRLHFCQRRHCYVWPHLKDIEVEWGAMVPRATPETMNSVVPETIDVLLPNNIIPISSGAVPDEVAEYLARRRFDPETLYREYGVHYAPPGTVWDTRTDAGGRTYDLTFKYPRILIPIHRGHHQVSWQARIAVDPVPDGVPKYINCPHGMNKTDLVYNMDAAKWHTEIGIFEGITDVWRAGPASIALLGKGISDEQIAIIKDLWGHYGFGVVFPDGDDPDSDAKANEVKNKLNAAEAFGHMACKLKVPPGKDPGDHTTQELDQMKACGVQALINHLKERNKK